MPQNSEVVTIAARFAETTTPEQRTQLHDALRECLLGTTTTDAFSLVLERARLLLKVTSDPSILTAFFTWVTSEVMTGSLSEVSIKNNRPRRRPSTEVPEDATTTPEQPVTQAETSSGTNEILGAETVLPTNTLFMYLLDNGCDEGFITRYLNILLRASLITYLPNRSIEFSTSFVDSLLNSTTYEEFSQNFTPPTDRPLRNFGAIQFVFWKKHLSTIKKNPTVVSSYADQVSQAVDPSETQPILPADQTISVTVLLTTLTHMQYLGAGKLLQKLQNTLHVSQYRYNAHLAIHANVLPLEVLELIKLHDFTRFHIAINFTSGGSKILSHQEYADLKTAIAAVLDTLPTSV